jgi:hypothetical protein
MTKILAILLLAAALPSSAQEETDWTNDPAQLSCTPKKLRSSGALTLELGPDHGRELAIRRDSDDTWYFLIIGGPPDNVRLLMTPETFEAQKQIQIPASLITTEWTSREDVPVFTTDGSYTVFVSVALESEAGGYKCKIRYVH